MNRELLLFKTPEETGKIIATNAKNKRKILKITQGELSRCSGVSLGSIKRFEQTGEISLSSLLKIAWILDSLSEFQELFMRKEYSSIEEVLDETR